MFPTRLRGWFAALFLGTAAACGSGSSATPALPDGSPKPDSGAPGDGGTDAPSTPDADAGPTLPDEVGIAGTFARSAHPLPGGGWLIVVEKPIAMQTLTVGPERELVWMNADGTVRFRKAAPAFRAILDAAVHSGSGEVTMLLAGESGFSLARWSATGAPIALTPIVDDAIVTDPPAINDGESKSPIETVTSDVGRIAADGEGVVLATRTGRHSVIAYRVDFDAGTESFVVRNRTLVVPAHPIVPTALNGGTYDTFGQLAGHFAVHVVRSSSGTAWIAVEHARLESGAMVKAHAKVFGESLVTDPDWLDIFVTRVSSDGVRLGTTVVSTPNDDQLYGLRAIGDDVYALGRTEHWNQQGTGFEALVARVDPQGLVTVREVAVDRGDIAFDVAPAPAGGLIVVGASGYAQNPSGASITEESAAFARWLHPDMGETSLTLRAGPRHNEARFVLPMGDGRFWLGGMRDGPGTHSADGDASLLRASGFVAAVQPP